MGEEKTGEEDREEEIVRNYPGKKCQEFTAIRYEVLPPKLQHVILRKTSVRSSFINL